MPIGDGMQKMNKNPELKQQKRKLQFYVISLLLAMLLVILSYVLQNNYNFDHQIKNIHGASAFSWSNLITTHYQFSQDKSQLKHQLHDLSLKLFEIDPRIREIQLLKGTRFLFHTDERKNGQSIDPEDELDKQTYDDNTQIKFRLKKKNIRDKYLLRHHADLLSDQSEQLVLIQPIMKNKRKSTGIVKIKYNRHGNYSIGLIYMLIIAGIVFILSVFLYMRTRRYQWLISIASLLIVMFSSVLVTNSNYQNRVDNSIDSKRKQLNIVLNLIQKQDSKLSGAYLENLKNKNLSGFFDEFKTIRFNEKSDPHSRHGGFMLTTEIDLDYLNRQYGEFKKRTMTVSLAFLVMAYLVIGFILAGFAFRTLMALKKHYYSYIYIFPAMVGMVVLVFFPFVYGMTMGFFKITHKSWTFVGLNNFIEILSDFHPLTPGNFYFTLLVTVLWTVVNVALHVGIGMILALILNRPTFRMKRLFRVLLILPWAVPNYITALIWKGMFHKQFGAINAFLQVFGVEAVSWFNNFWTAFFANVATNTWLGFPFMMVISLGALQSIPAYLYEAAEVDGASKWQQFKNITLPLLKPALFPAVVLGTIWTFNMFNIIYLVSNGAPNRATDILITQAFRYAFEEFNWGYAAAYSIIIFIILLAYGTFSNRATKATEGVFD